MIQLTPIGSKAHSCVRLLLTEIQKSLVDKGATMRMNPYLSFKGQCEAAFKFYEQCLGAQLGAIFRYAGRRWRIASLPTVRTRSCMAVSHSATRC